jgi:hypothetical protein
LGSPRQEYDEGERGWLFEPVSPRGMYFNDLSSSESEVRMHFQDARTVCFRLDGDELSVTRRQNTWTVTWRGDTATGVEMNHALATLTLQARSATMSVAMRVLRASAGAEVGPSNWSGGPTRKRRPERR